MIANVLWGTLMAAAGLFMLVCGTAKSEFVVYRLLVARSRILAGIFPLAKYVKLAPGLISISSSNSDSPSIESAVS